jgi:hypothetical protein
MQESHGDGFFAACPFAEKRCIEGTGGCLFCYALLCFDNCPEKRDESTPHTIGIGWLKFIPFFGTLESSIFKGHKAKKDIPLFPTKKPTPRSAKKFFTNNPKERLGHLLTPY